MLHAEGWHVNHKRVERIWRREGLRVPMKQPKRGRLWLNDGSCIRLRPRWRNHVWAYDFVQARTHDGRPFRMLRVIDGFTRNGKLRDELPNGEIFYTLKEAQVLIEQWRNHYNTIRPHSSLGYRPPAPQTIVPHRVRSALRY